MRVTLQSFFSVFISEMLSVCKSGLSDVRAAATVTWRWLAKTYNSTQDQTPAAKRQSKNNPLLLVFLHHNSVNGASFVKGRISAETESLLKFIFLP